MVGMVNQIATLAPGQVAELLQQRIASGHYPAGTWLPAERELAEELNVGRAGVRTALSLLAERGLIVRARGRRPWVRTQRLDSSPDERPQEQSTALQTIAAILPQHPD